MSLDGVDMLRMRLGTGCKRSCDESIRCELGGPRELCMWSRASCTLTCKHVAASESLLHLTHPGSQAI